MSHLTIVVLSTPYSELPDISEEPLQVNFPCPDMTRPARLRPVTLSEPEPESYCELLLARGSACAWVTLGDTAQSPVRVMLGPLGQSAMSRRSYLIWL